MSFAYRSVRCFGVAILLAFGFVASAGADPFVPNDPYFSYQWHLKNDKGYPSVNIEGAWNAGYTGEGVVIGIVDTGVDYAHPDLAANYDASLSWDHFDKDSDPKTGQSEDEHATSVAGIAAARGGNGIGVTGAAPYATIASLRVLGEAEPIPSWTAVSAKGILYKSDVTKNEYEIDIKNFSYGEGLPYTPLPLEMDALSKSTAIHVWAAGNERDSPPETYNTSTSEPRNHPNSVVVAGVDYSGTYAEYSSFGPNIFISAPTADLGEFLGTTTTDLPGEGSGYDNGPESNHDYTQSFGGTSSASPLVAGVLAVVKQAQPNLNTRFAKHLMAITSGGNATPNIDPTDMTYNGGGDGATSGSAWNKNGGGYWFNQNYGFGVIDAGALVAEAVKYTEPSPLETAFSPKTELGVDGSGVTIPNDDTNGLSYTWNHDGTTPLEEVIVSLDMIHPTGGDFKAQITSPMGTSSRLFAWNPDFGDFIPHSFTEIGEYDDEGELQPIDWDYLSNAFWGENPQGDWTLKVWDDTEDFFAGGDDIGTLFSWQIGLRMGTLTETSLPGDATGDGIVDRADLAYLTAKLGTEDAKGDFDGDDKVTLADLAILQKVLSSAPKSNTSAVPEPSSVVLMLLGTFACALPRYKRRTP